MDLCFALVWSRERPMWRRKGEIRIAAWLEVPDTLCTSAAAGQWQAGDLDSGGGVGSNALHGVKHFIKIAAGRLGAC
jgi:hypothetical protein